MKISCFTKIIRKRFQYPNSILIIKDLVTINGMVTNSPWPSSLGTWVFCFCLFFKGSIALHQPHREPSVVLRDDVSSQRSNFSGGKKYHLHLYIWSIVGQGLLIGWTAGPALSSLGSGPLCSFLMEMRSEQWGGGCSTVSPTQGTLGKVQDLRPCPMELLPQSQNYYSTCNICSQLFQAKASSSALDALKQMKR